MNVRPNRRKGYGPARRTRRKRDTKTSWPRNEKKSRKLTIEQVYFGGAQGRPVIRSSKSTAWKRISSSYQQPDKTSPEKQLLFPDRNHPLMKRLVTACLICPLLSFGGHFLSGTLSPRELFFWTSLCTRFEAASNRNSVPLCQICTRLFPTNERRPPPTLGKHCGLRPNSITTSVRLCGKCAVSQSF